MQNGMNGQGAAETVIVGEPDERPDPISVRLDTPEQLAIVREIIDGANAAQAEMTVLGERHQAERREALERLNEANQERFNRLCAAAGVPDEASRELLKVDTEYLDQHNIAFLTEEQPQPERGGLDLASLLGGQPRTHF